MEAVLLWSHNGTNVIQNSAIIFTPPDLNHNLIISQSRANDSGNYACRAAIDDVVVEETIRVNVITGKLVKLPCSTLHQHAKYENKQLFN